MKSPKNNSGFFCVHCKKKVKEHPTSSRNHCSICLHSLHVDIVPGDRRSECMGIMEPIALAWHSKKGEQLVLSCKTCSHISFCKIAPDDNQIELLSLRKKPLYTKGQ